MIHGPQRVPIEKRRVQTIRLKFLNSYGPHNPGASEIAVFAARPSDEQLERFPEPPDEPLAGPPWVPPPPTPGFEKNPYQVQVDEQLARLAAEQADARAVAIENLSLMRAYQAADPVAARLTDAAADVRREAAICLGRIGNCRHLENLLAALDDESWSVRQAAWFSLSNLTGQEFAFDALAAEEKRAQQISMRRDWGASFQADRLTHDFVAMSADHAPWLHRERLAKALGAIGERETAVPVLVSDLREYTQRESNDRAERLFVQACIRALGRLGGGEARTMLIALLDNPCWAVYAADALGDVGGDEAAVALLKVLPEYAYGLDRADRLPALHHGNGHDLVEKRSANDVDYSGGGKIWTPRTAHAILLSLCRIECSSPQTIELLRKASPYIVANMPLDYDGISVYDVEPWETISAFLLERAGLRQAFVDAAFQALGHNRQPPANLPHRRQLVRVANGLANKTDAVLTPFASKILLSSCRAKEDVPLLIELLKHDSGWVRINAAKTLIALGAKEAVEPICRLLETAQDDADYGYFGGYGQPDWKPAAPGKYGSDSPWYIGADEYNDPIPRYKEAFLRALGRLGGEECVPLLVRYLHNDRNAMEIAYTAAQALADLRTPAALAALQRAETSHPIHNVRLVARVAREALQQHGLACEPRTDQEKLAPVPQTPAPDESPRAIVFIKGPRTPPNHWFFSPTLQAYNQTDEGPTYRVGFNVYKLEPPEPTGQVTQLTHFTAGFVADLQVSYDGRKALVARRGGADDPWWHLFEMNVDGSDLLCAAGQRPFVPGKDGSPSYDFWKPVDHGLYWMDMQTGQLTLIYNDPQTSEFEARPLAPRPVPPVVATSPVTRQDPYTGKLFCASIYATQEADVRDRGRYVRIVEGLPMVTRHSTQTGGGVAWMNHGGSVGRVLGVLPVAPDGSFSVELPADRLVHIQVLDADGYVVGNELNWHYVRPGETKGCVGCHERPDAASSAEYRLPLALQSPPVRCLPVGEMLYRAKNWVKQIDDENEERKRTVNAINVIGRL